MSGFTYPVDYTGSDSANRVTNELQLISSANFRNFKVLIPDFAPFYNTDLSVVHQDSGTVLDEGIDYILTHRFAEASLSIGIPIYGSISIINSNLNGVFVLGYNTVGGEWTLPAQKIVDVLASLVISPRVARWEQVVGYPTTFPPINHSHDDDDLTGMSDVVTALIAINNAINTAYANGFLNYASINEAIQGILSNKSISPATLKAVTDNFMAIIREEMADADQALTDDIESLVRDLVGDSIFINGGFNITNSSGNWIMRSGVGYVNGRRITQPTNQVLVGMSYPSDVWLSTYKDLTGSWQFNVTFAAAKTVTNLLRYSDDITSQHWAVGSNTTVEPNQAFGSLGNRNIAKITFAVAGTTLAQASFLESYDFGKTYLVSGYGRSLSGESRISGNIGQTSSTVYNQLPVGSPRRFSFPVVAGERNSLTLGLTGPGGNGTGIGVAELGEFQVEAYSVEHNLIQYGNDFANAVWTKTNVTIATDSIEGPYPESSRVDKLVVTAVNAVHEITQTVSLVSGREYRFYCNAQPAEQTSIRIEITNGTDTDGINVALAALDITPDTADSTGLIRNPGTSQHMSDGGSGTGFYAIGASIVPRVTGSYTITLRVSLGAFMGGGGGVYIGCVMLVANGFTQNLLFGSNDFTCPAWITNSLDISSDLNKGALLKPSVLSSAGDLSADKHIIKQANFKFRGGSTYNFMAEFKAEGTGKIWMSLRAGASVASINQSVDLYVDLVNSTNAQYILPSSGGWTAVSAPTITNLGSGWYRVQITATADASVTVGEIWIGTTSGLTSGTETYVANGDGVARVKNAQLSRLNVVSSYTDAPYFPISKYVSTTYQQRTDTDGGLLKPYVADDIYYYPVKLASLPSSLVVIDRRKVIRSVGSLVRSSMANGGYKAESFTAEPNTRYTVAAGINVYIPATYKLSAGDQFVFIHPLMTSFFLRTEDPQSDVLYLKDASSGTVKQDTVIEMDVDKLVTVTFDGSALNVIF